jgi:thiol:disulfide interchange protein DsbD
MKTALVHIVTVCAAGLAAAAPASAQVNPVAVRVAAAPETVRRGEAFTLHVRFEIDPPYHIYGPQDALGAVPTRVEPQPVAGVAFGAPAFPPPLEKDFPALGGKTFLYEKAVTVTIPATVAADAAPGPRTVTVKVTYAACTDVACLRPVKGKAVEGTVAVSDAPAVSNPAPPVPPVTVVSGAVPSPAPPPPDGGDMPYDTFAGFLLACVAGGVITLLMPCVYPMMPITLTYFIKQADGSRWRSFGLAGMYSLGIIATFTGLGMALSIALGARGAIAFAADPWVNLAIAAVFLAFALSMFGLFEIRLPGAVSGALTARPRQGLAGAFVLGLSFSIVTFTCTMPVASTLLGLAAGGSPLLAVAGMLVYSTTMAVPFFVLGLSPALMSAIPRSGGWLEAAKHAMGFLELALVVYYASKVVWGFGAPELLNRESVIGLWLAASTVAALRLLGWIRLRGQESDRPAGPGQTVVGLAAGAFSVFLLTGLAGRDLPYLEPLLPLRPPPATAAGSPEAWLDDFDKGLQESKASHRPYFVEFTAFT